jgi:hypothetical protein
MSEITKTKSYSFNKINYLPPALCTYFIAFIIKNGVGFICVYVNRSQLVVMLYRCKYIAEFVLDKYKGRHH